MPVASAAPLTIEDVQDYASFAAKEHGLNVKHFLGTIECESHWDFEAVGDDGTSFGIAQLHYPSRDWGIATSSAFNPKLSIDIMADSWSKGEARRWSCWKALYGK